MFATPHEAVDSDRLLLDRATRRVGLQAAALVALVVLAVAVVVGLFVVHEQRSSDEALLRHAAADADDATDPPAGMWLAIIENGDYEATKGLPRDLPYLPDLNAVAAGQRGPLERRLSVDRVHVEILTQARPAGAVQAVLNLRTQDQLETHVFQSLLLVGLGGLVASAGVGSFLARRAVRPLALALTRQREFVADASHELRTPLTLLSTRAQLLHRTLATGGDGSELTDAAAIVADAACLAEVVEDLLLAADPRRDAAQPRQLVDLGDLCEEVVASVTPYADEQGVAVVLDRRPALVPVNAAAIRRAILALLDNAIAHTPTGGEVRVEVDGDAAGACVTVTDTGPGLAAADADRLFRRFASGEQAASRRSYGLGLALVRDVAARHGGQISLVPAPLGYGARFRLEIPTGESWRRWLRWRSGRGRAARAGGS